MHDIPRFVTAIGWNHMLYEFLDAVSITQCVGMAFNQSGEENHSIRVDPLSLLAPGKIGSRPHVGNSSIPDPNGLAFDKLFGKNIEESTIDENGIRAHSPK